MSEKDIIFTAHNKLRKITYTLYRGAPLSFGFEHIEHQRPYLTQNPHILKIGVEETDIAYWDSQHGARERIYCLGADKTRPELYVAVIVEYENSSHGHIITAWQTRDLCEGDITYVKPKR